MTITEDSTYTAVDAVAPDEGPRTYTQEELDTRVREALDLAREDLQSRVERAQQMHRDDITMIGETLLREAENRHWCSEYDGVVDAINSQLNIELPTRERDYDVIVLARITIRVPARDEDGARNAAAEIASTLESHVDDTDGVHTSSWGDRHEYEINER